MRINLRSKLSLIVISFLFSLNGIAQTSMIEEWPDQSIVGEKVNLVIEYKGKDFKAFEVTQFDNSGKTPFKKVIVTMCTIENEYLPGAKGEIKGVLHISEEPINNSRKDLYKTIEVLETGGRFEILTIKRKGKNVTDQYKKAGGELAVSMKVDIQQ